jgi:hypothetical protein
LVVATTAGADDAMPARREKAIFGFPINYINIKMFSSDICRDRAVRDCFLLLAYPLQGQDTTWQDTQRGVLRANSAPPAPETTRAICKNRGNTRNDKNNKQPANDMGCFQGIRMRQ